jgi:hypothetical protein
VGDETHHEEIAMSFEAKRLRVQLPCGGVTVREIDAGGVGCPFPTDVCVGGTCWFQSPPVCRFPTEFCPYPTIVACAYFGSPCPYGTRCPYGTCPFDTCGFVSPCGWRSPIQCGPGTDLDVDPGRILVDPEHLPVLRERLEAQLKEIEKAEEELKKRQEANE